MENQRVKRSRVGSALFVMQRRGVCGVPHGRALANSVLVGAEHRRFFAAKDLQTSTRGACSRPERRSGVTEARKRNLAVAQQRERKVFADLVRQLAQQISSALYDPALTPVAEHANDHVSANEPNAVC